MSGVVGELFDVSGKVACVTGASSGLGKRAATVLAEAGATVIGVARREAELWDWRNSAGPKAGCIVHDLSNRAKLSALSEEITKSYGSPDILVHAAGINPRQTADQVTLDQWELTHWLNLSLPFFLSELFVKSMKQKGWGRIVNFASLQTTRAFPGGISYGASKSGVGQLTRAMAEARSGNGINANAIGPSFFQTELTKAVFEDHERSVRNAKQTCIGRNGNLEDLDGPLFSLCSEASRYVTGQILMVDGGFTAK